MNQELEAILTKSFSDIRRRVTNLMAKREKQLIRELQKEKKKERASKKGHLLADVAKPLEKTEKGEKNTKKKERKTHRSSSSSSDSE